MKITNSLLLVAVAASLAACEKQSTDTANPGDATPAEAPATDDATTPADDALGGDEDATSDDSTDESDAEGDAEEPTADE